MSRQRLALGVLMACALVTGTAHAQNTGPAQTDIDQVIKDLAGEDIIDQRAKQEVESKWNGNQSCRLGSITSNRAKEGGWPGPIEHMKFRFIRLDHGGQGWDDGMDKSGADINFLKFFRDNTAIKKIANKGEAHKIALLKKYPDDGFPPFVFLTGNGAMGRVAMTDIKILREYCLKGGMIFADAGSAKFHQSFVHTMRQVFPDKRLVDIADDDMLYQMPYTFPKGAPAFWAHGGRRPLGIKHEGRWVVIYHPGDMNDAWKSEGFIDVTPEIREDAMKLGINVVFYAFNQWSEATSPKKQEKKNIRDEVTTSGKDINKQDSIIYELPDTDLFNPKN